MALAIMNFSYIGLINKTFQSITPVSTDKYNYLVKELPYLLKIRPPITPNGFIAVLLVIYIIGMSSFRKKQNQLQRHSISS